MPAPEGSKVGDDVAEQMGIVHYEPPLHLFMGGEKEKPPPRFIGSKYDVDSLRRYHRLFVPGEPVFLTEKIHGASSRYTCRDGVMHVGSRTEWKRESESNLWWRALKATPELRLFCENNQELTVFGEVYGQVQDLKYGMTNQVAFAAFDLARPDGTWYDAVEGRKILYGGNVPMVPLLASGMDFDFDVVCSMAEGPSTVHGAKHVREGVVVKPITERWDEKIGRVCLKVVGAGYLEKS